MERSRQVGLPVWSECRNARPRFLAAARFLEEQTGTRRPRHLPHTIGFDTRLSSTNNASMTTDRKNPRALCALQTLPHTLSRNTQSVAAENGEQRLDQDAREKRRDAAQGESGFGTTSTQTPPTACVLSLVLVVRISSSSGFFSSNWYRVSRWTIARRISNLARFCPAQSLAPCEKGK